MQSTRDRLADLVVKSLRLPNPPSTFDGVNLIRDLGVTSVDALEILIGIEVEFGIEIPDQDLRSDLLESLDVLQAYVDQRLSGAAQDRGTAWPPP
jgi:acyl carrier protein